MRVHLPLLLLVTSCFPLLSPGRCSAQDDPLALTLPNGKVVHFESEEQKAKFEAGRNARAARTADETRAQTQTTAAAPASGSPAAGATPSVSVVPPSSTPIIGSPMVNTSAPAFTADYYGLPKSGLWVGRKITLAVAYVRQHSEVQNGLVKFTAHTWNGRPGAASRHMEGGSVTILATENAARKLLVQAGTDFRYGIGGMTITMLHGVVQPLEANGEKGYGVFVDY